MHSSASSGERSHPASVDGDHSAHHTANPPPTSVVSSSVPPSPPPLTVATSRTFTPEALSPASAHTPFGHESGSRPTTAGMNIEAPYRGGQRASSGAADLNADSNQITPGSLQVLLGPVHLCPVPPFRTPWFVVYNSDGAFLLCLYSLESRSLFPQARRSQQVVKQSQLAVHSMLGLHVAPWTLGLHLFVDFALLSCLSWLVPHMLLQSAVDSLHTIADHLPGLLDGNSESPAYFNEDGSRRSSLRPITSEQVPLAFTRSNDAILASGAG